MSNLVIIFISGTVVGSFLNVLIHRLPRGESIVYPASHCPQCNHRLAAFDLIPVLSWFFLCGRCRYCKTSISWRYPLVEAVTGLLFVAVYSRCLLSTTCYRLSFELIFVSMLSAVFFIDLEHQVIPDILSVAGIVLGLIFNLLNGLGQFYAAFLGMVAGYAILFLVGKLGKIIFKKEAMGEGDLYLAAMLGAFLGWQNLLLALFLAYLVAAVVAVIFLALGKVKMGQQVAFGPALAVGGVLTLFYGNQIMNWYLSLLW